MPRRACNCLLGLQLLFDDRDYDLALGGSGLQLLFGDRDYDLALGGLFGKSGVLRQVPLSFYELGV